MKQIKQRTIDGRKVAVKELSAREQEKHDCTYVITVDGDIDWKTDSLEEAMEFFDDWGN